MAKLNTYVHATATGPDGVQLSGTFGPADDLPDWAAAAITNPDVWDGDPPAASPAAEPAPPATTGGGDGDLVEPPRSGKGSGLEAWVAYAKDLGYDVAEGATREQIIAAIDAEKE